MIVFVTLEGEDFIKAKIVLSLTEESVFLRDIFTGQVFSVSPP